MFDEHFNRKKKNQDSEAKYMGMLGKQEYYLWLLAAITTFDDSSKLALLVFGTLNCER